MADINVERKKHHAWPWILGLVVLALLVWAIASMTDGDNEVADAMPVTTNEATVDDTYDDAARDAATTDTTTDTTADDTPAR